ncbi:MAG: MFS transporter [Akkermansiaceae bacterium]|nr:MFS transporter [Akkermansiaceae bacterium]
MSKPSTAASVVPRALLVPFVLVTLLFPLWGFANDITNPMVAAVKNILLLTNLESSLVQGAFYGGYALMAIPAAIFIKKFSYKSGILLGLVLYATGCLLFIPSGWSLSFYPFLLAYLVMTSGLSFLETTANPYVLSMGDESTATRRLNLAQAFNPMGSICGMFVASMFILFNLNGTSESGRRVMQAVADGTPVHTQIVDKQLEAANGLKDVLATPSFEIKRRFTKKAMETSGSIADTLEILADPKPKLAKEVGEKLAAQPVPDKFAAAANAVAIVMQLRDPVKPTEAEALREQHFHGAGGIELAGMVGSELGALADQPALAAAAPDLTAAAAAARRTATALDDLYQQKSDAKALVAEASSHLATLTTSLTAAQEKLKGIAMPQAAAYTAKVGGEFKEIRKADLDVVVLPYALMGFFLIGVLVLFAWKLPKATAHEGDTQLHFGATMGRLFHNRRYLGGVAAQTFYVGAQIMCWTYIIQYAELELGVAKSTAQNCNILAMIIFVSSRFICTLLLHYIKPGFLLFILATGGMLLTAGTIFIQGYTGLYCLMGVSACMSLMFPTIYGIALDGLGDDAKLGSAGLILAIGGGCILPVLQGYILDLPPINFGFMELASVRASFFLPAICFLFIAAYGFWVNKDSARTA